MIFSSGWYSDSNPSLRLLAAPYTIGLFYPAILLPGGDLCSVSHAKSEVNTRNLIACFSTLAAPEYTGALISVFNLNVIVGILSYLQDVGRCPDSLDRQTGGHWL